MKRTLLSLLLLAPILALAQELPDEDWVCLTERAVTIDEFGFSKMEDLPNFIFNPAKGVRTLPSMNSEVYVPYQCSTDRYIDKEIFEYMCNTISSPSRPAQETFQMVTATGAFSHTYTIVSVNAATDVSHGNCTKL